jgi:hypothetical protein
MNTKTLILSLMISGLLLGAFSCGDNKGGNPDDYFHPYGYIEGIFPDPVTGRELILVYNGDSLSNKKVDFVSRGIAKPQAVLTFENVITGEAKTVLTVDLIESQNHDNSGISRLIFNGVYSIKSRSIKYSGFIEPLLMLLELKEE